MHTDIYKKTIETKSIKKNQMIKINILNKIIIRQITNIII